MLAAVVVRSAASHSPWVQMNASAPVPTVLTRAAKAWLSSMSFALLVLPLAASAQPDLRSTFPGRRIGGGTRGECSARLLAHLVPSSSVYAPGAGLIIGLLEGPTAQPRPLQVTFRPLSNAGTAAQAQGRTTTRELPAAPTGVVLLSVAPVKGATIWESGYRCEDASGAAAGADPLDFVQSVSPPAVSLLVSDVLPDDKTIQAGLKTLRAFCGKSVATAEVAKTFALADVVTLDWPSQLPVRCP